jgi:hypothetical protein
MVLITLAIVGGVTTTVIATATYAILQWKKRFFLGPGDPYDGIYSDDDGYFVSTH